MSTTQSTYSRDEAVAALHKAIAGVAPDVKFHFEMSGADGGPVLQIGDSSCTLTGNGSFMGVSGVSFTAYFTLGGKPNFFRADLPDVAAVGSLNLDALAGGADWRQLLLPDNLRNRFALASWTAEFDTSKNRPSKLNLSFGVAGQLSPVDGLDITMKGITVGYEIENPLAPLHSSDPNYQRKISGQLAASFNFLGVDMKVTSNLVTDWDEWKLTSESYSVTRALPELWKLVKGEELMPWPPFLDAVTVSRLQIELYPTNRLDLSVWSDSFGDGHLIVKRSVVEGKLAPLSTQLAGGYSGTTVPEALPSKSKTVLDVLLAYSLPPNQPIAGALSILNSLRPTHAGMVVSTFKDPMDSTLQIFAGLGSGDARAKRGVTFLAMVDVNRYEDENLKKLLKNVCRHLGTDIPLNSLLIRGNIPLPPELIQNFSASVAITFADSVNYFDRVFLRNIGLEAKPAAADPEFTVSATLAVVWDDPGNPLVFRGGLGLQPMSLTLIGKFQMDGAVNLPRPFGFPGVSFANLAAQLGIKFSTDIPTPDNLFLSGEMQINGIAGNATLGIDQNEIGRNMVLARFCNLDFASILDAFCGPEIARKIPAHVRRLVGQSGIRNVYVKLIPPGAAPSFMGGTPPPDPGFRDNCFPLPMVRDNDFSPGFSLAGQGALLEWEGEFVFNLEGEMSGFSAGLTAIGRMTPLPIPSAPLPKLPGDVTLFRITGSGGQGRPELYVDLSTRHAITGIADRFKPARNDSFPGQSRQFPAAGPVDSTTTSGYRENQVIYCSANLTVLGLTGDLYLDLTTVGFQGTLNGNICGFLRGNLQVTIASFGNPLSGTSVSGSVDQAVVTAVQDRARDAIKRNFGDRMARVFGSISSQVLDLRSITFSGTLESYRTQFAVEARYKVAGREDVVRVSIDHKTVEAFAERLAQEIVRRSRQVFEGLIGHAEQVLAELDRAVERSAAELRETATKATTLAHNTVSQATQVANDTRQRLATGAAQVAVTSEEFGKVAARIHRELRDFAVFAQGTVEKIFNRGIGEIRNGWDNLTKEMKRALTGADNEELVMANGPAFRIFNRGQGGVLTSPSTTQKDYPVNLQPMTSVSLEAWQLIPNDEIKEGSFYLVSGHSALLVAKPHDTHLVLIPHESDHKNRERMLMEAVPNEPGWYYLKYRETDKEQGVVHQTYAEVRSIRFNDEKSVRKNPGFTLGVAQWVLAPVRYAAGRSPGDAGKFRFEMVGEIEWGKSRQPRMNLSGGWSEGDRYQVKGLPEQYVYAQGKLRWIPDYETLMASPWRDKLLTAIPSGQVVGMVLGDPMPSRKDGALLRERGTSAVFIMDGGERRWVPDPETFRILALSEGRIQEVSKADLDAIPRGADLPSRFVPRVELTERALYQVPGNPVIYMVLGRTLRAVPDSETLSALGYRREMVIQATPEVKGTLSIGIPLASRREGSLVQAHGLSEVYLLERGLRRHIPDPETFGALGLDWGRIQRIPPSDLEEIPLGPALPSRRST